MDLLLYFVVGVSFLQDYAFCQLGEGYKSDNYNRYSNNSSNNKSEVVEYVFLNGEDPCARKCIKGAPSMVCRYNFKVEWYHTMSKACYACPYNREDCVREDCITGDGTKRPVFTINRKLPGPTIQACLGDEIIVDVQNLLASESTTIHYHGLLQMNNPYMDGVPFITQCPILPGNSFRYHFSADNVGTHFWHSHTGMQRGDGAFGALIIRQPLEDDPHAALYDFDLPSHTIQILDWGTVTGLDKFLAHHHNDGDNKPVTLLINGLARYQEFDTEDNSTLYIPPPTFTVRQGFKYRFRIINAGFLNCPVAVTIDNHTLTVISTDSYDLEPTVAATLVTYAGERWDFIVNANQTEGSYLIRFYGLMDCDERFNSAHQEAVLQYEGTEIDNSTLAAARYENAHKDGVQINPLNMGTEVDNSTFKSLPLLKSVLPWDKSLKPIADFQYYIAYDFYKLNNPHFHDADHYAFKNVSNPKQQVLTPQLNHISMKFPTFPLLPQRNQIDESMFCNETTMDQCDPEFCECTHVVRIPLGSIVELILIDEGVAYDANHPFHLHGNSFRVVAMERLGRNTTFKEVFEKDRKGEIQRNLKDAPYKDTVTVPDGGYTVVRFIASNPGYWLFHCHIEFHSEIGMAIIFKVGDHSQMKPVPRNFPTCGSYLPDSNSEIVDCTSNNITVGDFKKYCSSSNTICSLHHRLLGLLIFAIMCIFR